jgi:Zn-finger nucleic acid-binding protein
MSAQTFDGHQGRSVEVDLCDPCQSLWFDAQENLQLTPGATLALFRLIGEHVSKPSIQDGEIAKCPKCHARLRRTSDLQRGTRFEYFRCPNSHGRLTTFFQFLREKDFIKPLNAQQVAELRRKLQTVNCSNCGGPIDLAQGSDCSHCGSPLSMLDMAQAERLITQLQEAESYRTSRQVDPALPLALARARLETESAFKGLPGHDPWASDPWQMGLVGAGLRQLMELLKRDS